MSVNITAELHPLRSMRVKLAAEPKPIAEIIRELNTGFPLSQARVSRNGEIVKDFSTAAQDGDALWIKFVPYGSTNEAGYGMKAGGWALMFAGIAVGFALGWTGVGAGVAAALIGTGLSTALGGQVLMNLHIPSLKDREKPENDPSIRGGKNQARPHGRIPVLFGRHRIYPDLAANPHTSIINGQQYFTQLFCGGYKDCVIGLDSFKLGETPLADLSQTKSMAQILAGADPLVRMEIIQDGRPPELYPHCVHEDMINAALKNKIDGGDGSKISGEITRTTPDNTDVINVDIFLYNGIGKYNKKGDLKSASVEVKAYYKRFGDDDLLYELLGNFNEAEGSNTLSGNELKTKRYQITAPVPRGRYTVKIERATPDSSDSKIIDEVYVGSIRSIKSIDDSGQPVRPVRPERQKDLTIIALRVAAADKFNGIVDSLNYIAESKLPVYSGAGSGPLYWLAAAETRNPAAMLLHALRGGPAQQRVDPDDIDWPSFENFYQWCGDRGYFCDAYLSEAVTVAELLRMIGGTSRADILRIDSKITVVQDIERPTPMQLFTPKNTKSYSVTMFQADIPDAVALRFIDEGAGYAQTELKVYHTPNGGPPEAGGPETIQKTDLWGITNSVQARRIGMYTYACLKNRPFVHTVEVDIEYLLCSKGDRILYAGDIALTGSVQGRIVEVLWSPSAGRYAGIRLDEPVITEPGKQYAVRIRRSDGSILLKDVALVSAPDEVYFTEPLKENDAPRRGDIYAFGIRGKEVIDLVITDIQPQADLSAALTCVEYSPAIFDVDDDSFILPEFENKITPVSGAIDSGVVGPSRWRLFVTYHDDEREPPRPEGGGQGGGWHYAHTTPSLWQSSKTAESVDAGEWGPPVRIKGERGNTDTVAVYLTLSPQTKILKCDGDGNLLAGSLPFTVQAELFKWNYKIPAADGSPRYPGAGGKLIDPMLGGLFPAEPGRGITFSLVDAPAGVTVNNTGRIAVAADAVLGDGRRITVQAEYKGETYTAELVIQIEKRVGEARYLGTVDTLSQRNPEAAILKGRNMGRVTAGQADYVFAVAGGTVGAWVWKMGYVYQWTGFVWEERDPVMYTDLYMLCFKDGLEVQELKQDMGWFGAVFASRIVALRAFIEELEAQMVRINDVIYGGDRFTKNAQGQIVDNGAALDGFKLTVDDGKLVASGAEFNNIKVTNAEIEGGINGGKSFAENGNLLPNPTLGGIFLRKDGVTATQVFNLKIFESLSFNKGRGLRPSIQYNNATKDATNSYSLITPEANGVSGAMSLSALSAQLESKNSAVGYVAMFGIIAIFAGSKNYGTPNTYIITYAYRGGNYWSLYGQPISGGPGYSSNPLPRLITLNTDQLAHVNLIWI